MQYIEKSKNGIKTITGIFTIYQEGPDAVNIVLGTKVESVRRSMSKNMGKVLKKIKPEGDSLSWSTKIGVFAIYKGYEYENNNPYGSKFRNVFLFVELDPIKYGGEVETKQYFIKKEPNPDCEDYEDCECREGLKAMYEVKTNAGVEMRCIKCKRFHAWMDRISKKLDKEKETKKKK